MQPFQVFARVRPLNERQNDYFNGRKAVGVVSQDTLSIGQQEGKQSYFQLDTIFGQDDDNMRIFQTAVQPLADNFLNGVNSTIFAYGITGAGKSFTMFGRQNQQEHTPGLIQLTIEYICNSLENTEDCSLSLSYMEIYNEQVFDLLRQKSQSLQILDDPVAGVIVSDLEQIPIFDTATALKCIQDGNYRRVVAETRANQFSSRSHAIVQVSFEKKVGDCIITGKLSLVDLAGSEKQSVYSENRGIRNFQGSNINKSLLTLGNCINILSARKGYVPYRDSKLTRLLKDSLGGNTRTAMIACISPSLLAFQETLNTLKYACRARKIEKNVHQNVKQPRTVQQFKREIGKLRRQLQLSKSQGGLRSYTREEMQQFLQRLIKNVEQSTKFRLLGSTDIHSKLREVELIEQQRTIINGILCRFEDQPKQQERFAVKSNQNEKIPMQRRKSKQQISYKQVNNLQRITEQMDNTEEIDLKRQQGIQKSVCFQVSKLQEKRLKHRQARRKFKELVMAYHQTYRSPQLRIKQMEIAFELQTDQEYLCSEEKQILNKIGIGEQLSPQQLSLFNLAPQLKQGFQNVSPVQTRSNNRFMNSLQEIRKMMRKIAPQNEIIPQSEDEAIQNYQVYPLADLQNYSQALFNDY